MKHKLLFVLVACATALSVAAFLFSRLSGDVASRADRPTDSGRQEAPGLAAMPRPGPMVPGRFHLLLTFSSKVENVLGAKFLVSVSSGGEHDVLVVRISTQGGGTIDAPSGWISQFNPRLFRTSVKSFGLSLSDLPSGDYHVDAQSEAPHLHAHGVRVAVRSDVDVTIDLLGREMAEAGRVNVTFSDDRPVEFAAISIMDGSEEVSRIWLSSKEPSSTIGGSSLVPSDRLLTAKVAFFRPGFHVLGSPEAQQFEVSAGGDANLAFKAPVSYPVSLRARDRDGESIAISVSLWRTSGDGGFEFVDSGGDMDVGDNLRRWSTRLLPGRYSALIQPMSALSATWHDFSVAGHTEVTAIVTGAVGTRARLQVLGADGLPMANARVNVNRVARSLRDAVAISGSTDEAGGFVTPPVPTGVYEVILWEAKLSQVVTVQSTSRMTLHLPEASEGKGCVQGEVKIGDVPVPSARVRLRSTSGWARVTQTDGWGRFRIDGVEDGDYVLLVPRNWFSKNQHESWESPITVSGCPTDPILIRLSGL